MECVGRLVRKTDLCRALIQINPNKFYKCDFSLPCGCLSFSFFLHSKEEQRKWLYSSWCKHTESTFCRLFKKVCLKCILDGTELKLHLSAVSRIWCPLSVLIPYPLCKHVAFLINSFSSECNLAWFDLLSRAIAFHISAITFKNKAAIIQRLMALVEKRTITLPSVASLLRDMGIRRER